MIVFLSWFLTLLLVQVLAFPLAFRLFPRLPGRGYAFARPLGLLVWGFAFWLPASLRLSGNDLGGALLGLVVLAGLSLWAGRGRWKELGKWLTANWKLAVAVEALFLLAFGLMAVVRAANPETVGTEKPMELAFINAILRSPDFPPRDPWLSGYAISYYHFGYILTALLARFTAVSGALAFNLMLALTFALTAAGAYGLVHELLALRRDGRGPLGLPLLGPLFLLLVSNFEAVLEVLHRRGLFWDAQTGQSAFWAWLDIKELNAAPLQPSAWLPDRYWWWWRASRVVQDLSLTGNSIEIIDEFPFFSYLLGDLHPHVLAMPFFLLVAAVALHLYAGGWRTERNWLRLEPVGFLSIALTVGGLAFINTWDILPALALTGLAYLLARRRHDGPDWAHIERAVVFGVLLVAASLALYLPFYLGFDSQAGGLMINLIHPTRGAHLWVMFAPLLIPLSAYLLHLRRADGLRFRLSGPGWALLLGLGLWALTWLIAIVVYERLPEIAMREILYQGVDGPAAYFTAAGLRRLASIGGLLTILAVLGGALGWLPGAVEVADRPAGRADGFVLALVLVGALLVLGPEFFYLRDQFGSRMNTIFKFYFQGWQLWSVAAACGAAILLDELRGWRAAVWSTGLTLLLLLGLVYPALSLPDKTYNFSAPRGWTLDGSAHLQWDHPSDAAAIAFLLEAPYGVVAEAVGGQYSYYARIATCTGLPAVIGWPGHEGQWRGSYTEQGDRPLDISILYSTRDWAEARAILDRYDIDYVIVGALERVTYQVYEDKFQRNLPVLFQSGDTTVYGVP